MHLSKHYQLLYKTGLSLRSQTWDKLPRHPFNISKQTLVVRFYLQPSISTSHRALLAGIPGPYPDFSASYWAGLPCWNCPSLYSLTILITWPFFGLPFILLPLGMALPSPAPSRGSGHVHSELCRCPCLWLSLSLPFIFKKPPPPYLGAIISFPFSFFFF